MNDAENLSLTRSSRLVPRLVQDRSPRTTLYRRCGARVSSVLCRPVSSSSGRRVYALPHVVISLFRDSDFEDLATGLLLSLGPTCGTRFRPKLDNRVTIYYSSRVN